MKNLFIFLLLIAFSFSCKKDKANPTPPAPPSSSQSTEEYIQFKVAGINYKYSHRLPGKSDTLVSYYDSPFTLMSKYSLNLQSFAAISFSDFDLDSNNVPIILTADSNIFKPTPGFEWYDTKGVVFESGCEWSSLECSPYFTTVITSKTNDIIEGSFFGTIHADTSSVYMPITEGKFRVKIYRK